MTPTHLVTRSLTLPLFALALAACEPQQQAAAPAPAIDPENVVITEDVAGSEFPVDLTLVETVDGLYTPIGIRRPKGDGPFPIVLFASGNGGGGMKYIRHANANRSWTLERFLEAGYAVAWLRYRAEVELAYHKYGALVQDVRQGRQLYNRGPLEYDDEIAIIKYVKNLPYIDGDRVGLVGLSHGGEMVLKVTSEYDGIAAAIANEPASHEFLALRPDDTAFINPETQMVNLEEMQMREVDKVRRRVDMDVAMKRISTINTPILVHGRNTDHLQGIFRLTYELLKEAGKDVEWVSYEHPRHGFIYVERNEEGVYAPDEVEAQSVTDAIAFFDRRMK